MNGMTTDKKKPVLERCKGSQRIVASGRTEWASCPYCDQTVPVTGHGVAMLHWLQPEPDKP